ncbi:hypothetical protein IMZ48_28675 [Candidatus Bathyarchaeota archaeon]|nr:hypothetical protein [Candidatus Bathyarchaeota archaeon]
MRHVGALNAARERLPRADGEAARAVVLVLLLLQLLGQAVGILGLLLLEGLGPLVEAAGAGGAQELLGVGRQEVGILGEAVKELDGPNVVGLRGLGGRRRGDLYPLGAPLADGETCRGIRLALDALGGGLGAGRSRTFKVVMLGVAGAMRTSRLEQG